MKLTKKEMVAKYKLTEKINHLLPLVWRKADVIWKDVLQFAFTNYSEKRASIFYLPGGDQENAITILQTSIAKFSKDEGYTIVFRWVNYSEVIAKDVVALFETLHQEIVEEEDKERKKKELEESQKKQEREERDHFVKQEIADYIPLTNNL